MAADGGKGRLFRDVVDAVEREGHGLCVLRGYREYPENIGPDIDVISDAPELIPAIVTRQKIATVVQVFEHETTFYYLCRWENGHPVFITLDVAKDYAHRGRTFLRGEEFLETARRFDFFDIPSAGMEFISYLLRKVAQGSIGEEPARRLSGLYREHPEGCKKQLGRFFPRAEAALIATAAEDGEWEAVRVRLEDLRRSVLGGDNRSRERLRYWVNVARRRIGRVLRPPGLMVAFMGTDGSGKSTVMERVEENLGPAFWGRKYYHKRPLSSPFRWVKRYGLRPPKTEAREDAGEGDPATGFNPHGLRSRGAAYSLAKLGFWWADFLLLGYAVDILPRLTRPMLLLFDRYYQDLLVDPVRYHYGGSLSLARLVGRFIPQPHLTILLDAPPEVLHSRKQELPIEEVTRQREAYLEVVSSLPNGHVVSTTGSVEEAVAEIESAILDYMAGRTAKRLGLRPEENRLD